MIFRLLIASVVLLLCALPAAHAEPPALEARVLAIADELRCLVCQNETIAASQSGLAVDLRQQIRSQLQQGRNEAQIVGYMVERYGDFVRYRPAFDARTALLWLGPFVLLVLTAAALWRARRKPLSAAPPPPLSAAERRRADELLQP